MARLREEGDNAPVHGRMIEAVRTQRDIVEKASARSYLGLCCHSVIGNSTGGLTRTIAIVAVVACGIAAMAGKLSWDLVIKIVVDDVLMVGSASIAAA